MDTATPTATATAVISATTTPMATAIAQLQVMTSNGTNAGDSLVAGFAVFAWWVLFGFFLWLMLVGLTTSPES